jgi:predicted dehydrogenase
VQHFKAVVAGHFDPTPEEVDKALETSPYGRCVFKCDNDVVDHQIASFTFEGGVQATLTMSAFNKGGRTTTFMGTKGELRANMEKNTLEFYSFDTLETTDIYNHEEAVDQTIAGGHGGGDLGIMADLYEYVANNNPSNSISDIGISSMSYLMCFAAELSRETNTVVDMQDYMYNLQYK